MWAKAAGFWWDFGAKKDGLHLKDKPGEQNKLK